MTSSFDYAAAEQLPAAQEAATLRTSGATRHECGVCWYVYDPASGDPVWQVPPGTAFEVLPERWSCPNCDAPREKFLAL
ncbi:MAG: rubredoxin [Anaeromyxobacter sp.]